MSSDDDEAQRSAAPQIVELVEGNLRSGGALGEALFQYFTDGGLLIDDISLVECFAEVRTRQDLIELIKGNMEQSSHKHFALPNLANVLLRRCREHFVNLKDGDHPQQVPPSPLLSSTLDQQPPDEPRRKKEKRRRSPRRSRSVSPQPPLKPPILTTPSASAKKRRTTRQTSSTADEPFVARQSTGRFDGDDQDDIPPPPNLGSPIRISAAHDGDSFMSSSDPSSPPNDSPSSSAVEDSISMPSRGWGKPVLLDSTAHSYSPSKDRVRDYLGVCRISMSQSLAKHKESVERTIKRGNGRESLCKKLIGTFAKSSTRQQQQLDFSQVLVPPPGQLIPKARRSIINKKYSMRAHQVRAVADQWVRKPWQIVNGFKLDLASQEPQLAFVYPSGLRSGYYDFVFRVEKISADVPGIVYGTVVGRGFYEEGSSYTDPVFGFRHFYSQLRVPSTDFCVSLSHCFEYHHDMYKIVEELRALRGTKRGPRLYNDPTELALNRYFSTRPAQFTTFKAYMDLPIQPSSDDVIEENGGEAEPDPNTFEWPDNRQVACSDVAQLIQDLEARKAEAASLSEAQVAAAREEAELVRATRREKRAADGDDESSSRRQMTTSSAACRGSQSAVASSAPSAVAPSESSTPTTPLRSILKKSQKPSTQLPTKPFDDEPIESAGRGKPTTPSAQKQSKHSDKVKQPKPDLKKKSKLPVKPAKKKLRMQLRKRGASSGRAESTNDEDGCSIAVAAQSPDAPEYLARAGDNIITATVVGNVAKLMSVSRTKATKLLAQMCYCRDRVYGPPARLYVQPGDFDSPDAQDVLSVWQEPALIVDVIRSMLDYNKENGPCRIRKLHTGKAPAKFSVSPSTRATEERKRRRISSSDSSDARILSPVAPAQPSPQSAQLPADESPKSPRETPSTPQPSPQSAQLPADESPKAPRETPSTPQPSPQSAQLPADESPKSPRETPSTPQLSPQSAQLPADESPKAPRETPSTPQPSPQSAQLPADESPKSPRETPSTPQLSPQSSQSLTDEHSPKSPLEPSSMPQLGHSSSAIQVNQEDVEAVVFAMCDRAGDIVGEHPPILLKTTVIDIGGATDVDDGQRESAIISTSRSVSPSAVTISVQSTALALPKAASTPVSLTDDVVSAVDPNDMLIHRLDLSYVLEASSAVVQMVFQEGHELSTDAREFDMTGAQVIVAGHQPTVLAGAGNSLSSDLVATGGGAKVHFPDEQQVETTPGDNGGPVTDVFDVSALSSRDHEESMQSNISHGSLASSDSSSSLSESSKVMRHSAREDSDTMSVTLEEDEVSARRTARIPRLTPHERIAVKLGPMTCWKDYAVCTVDSNKEIPVCLDLDIEDRDGRPCSIYDHDNITEEHLVESFERIRLRIEFLHGDDAVVLFEPYDAYQLRWRGALLIPTLQPTARLISDQPASDAPSQQHEGQPDCTSICQLVKSRRRSASADRSTHHERSASAERHSNGDTSSTRTRRASSADIPPDASKTPALQNSIWQLILLDLHEKLGTFSQAEIFEKFFLMGGCQGAPSMQALPSYSIRKALKEVDPDWHDSALNKVTKANKVRLCKRLALGFAVAGYFYITRAGRAHSSDRFVDVHRKMPI